MVGTGIFTLLAFIIPPEYESVTKLMPPDTSNEGLSMLATLAGKTGDSSSGLGDLAGSMLGMKTSGAMFIGVLHSRTVQDTLVRRFDLRKVYGMRRAEDARRELESRTKISEDRKSGIIEAVVFDRSSQRAQALAQGYVEELDRAVNNLSTSAARREREFLEVRIAGVTQDLDRASKDFSQFASQNTAIDIPAQGKAMVEAAAILQGQLMAAEAEEQGLKQIYTPKNVRVRSLEGRIAELRRQLDQLGEAGTGEDTPQAADNPESSLYPSIRKIPILGVRYFDLFRRVKIQEALFEALTKRYEMAKVQEAKEIPTVRVLDPPNLADRRSSPHRIIIVLFGAVLSFALACSWSLGKAIWDETDPQDPRKLFLWEVSVGAKDDWATIRRRISRFVTNLKGNSAGLSSNSLFNNSDDKTNHD
jgi:capsule polysaccharide export protein KpsE/RkpR